MSPRRLAWSLVLLAATGTAVWLLVRLVSENAPVTHTAGPSPSAPAPSTRPSTSTSTTLAPRHTTSPTRAPKRPVVAGVTIPLGVYAGPGATAGATAFSADAGAPVPFAFDYLDWTTWQTIEDPAWFLQHWDGSGYRMIWGVPMLPFFGGATMAAGAAGQYNAYFTELAFALVDSGNANSLIMLGWDPGATGLPWTAATDADAAFYVAYWRQIVTAMRAVAGQQFVFVWDTAPGAGGVTPEALYPGNSYVDVIATDGFDAGPGAAGETWADLAATAYGPDWYANFAAQHKKPFMIAKWGVVPIDASGGGDNPAYVSQFLAWADKKHLYAAVLWDDGSWAMTGGFYPRSAAALRSVASSGAVAPLARAVGA